MSDEIKLPQGLLTSQGQPQKVEISDAKATLDEDKKEKTMKTTIQTEDNEEYEVEIRKEGIFYNDLLIAPIDPDLPTAMSIAQKFFNAHQIKSE